jgi:PIN domain nuclease of toxin-antitoxin system
LHAGRYRVVPIVDRHDPNGRIPSACRESRCAPSDRPCDRLLVAQRKTEKLRLVSRDTAFDAYGLKRMW